MKYLKPYTLFVLIVVLGTFLNVQAELKLPDKMSDIVTNGIQYSGVSDSLPDVILRDDFDKALLFSDQKEELLSCFEEISVGTKATVSHQEIQFNEDVYLLKEDRDKSLDTKISDCISSYGIALNINLSEADYSYETAQRLLDQYADSKDEVCRIVLKGEYEKVGLSIEVLQKNYILSQGALMLGLSLFGVITSIIADYFSSYIGVRMAADLREAVFRKVESFSADEFAHFSSSSLITRTTNDITQVQMLVQMALRMMLRVPMMGITSVFKVMRYPSMAWMLGIAVLIIFGCVILLMVLTMPKFSVIQQLTDKMNGVMREILDGLLVIRAFNTQKKEEERFDEINTAQSKINLFLNRVMALMNPVSSLIMNGLTVAIIYFAARQIDMNVMSVGEMMAFIQYAMHVIMSFMLATVMWVIVPRSLICARRVADVLNTENRILDPENPENIPEGQQVLSFDHVYFSYPRAEEYVLNDITFSASPGETIAIIGSTGSGKSTLVQLIPRLFDVSKGAVKYGDKDIREYTQKDLRERIAFISQKAVLFTGNIRDNISFGRQMDDEKILEAIHIAQGDNILTEKGEGLDAAVSQGGTNFSGGQKQRLSIARALAGDSSIYIFDDSFSALDYQTDRKLRAALSQIICASKAIVIIVAQRISTIASADKIIVLDGGKIVGMGKHEELLKDCDVYRQIAYSQLSEEELSHAA